jgi:hypothetical protein
MHLIVVSTAGHSVHGGSDCEFGTKVFTSLHCQRLQFNYSSARTPSTRL